jgi:hypothetical protein
MVPRAKTTQSWPLRPWRSQRKMYVVIYRGALRRRIRRLVRSRLFNNVRTATRNLDLPLAIATPPTGSPALCRDRNDSGSVWRQQGGPLSPLGHSGCLRTRRAVTKRSRGPDVASIATPSAGLRPLGRCIGLAGPRSAFLAQCGTRDNLGDALSP